MRFRLVKVAVAAGAVAALALIAVAVGYWERPSSAPLDENTLVIAPFRVSGADPSLRYLREGMVDLLAAKFTGESGPSAADPRTVMSAWGRTARSGESDLSEAEAVSLAEQLGAARLLLGGIVGTPRHVVLTASLLQVPSGRVAARATAEGSPDSLAAIVDRLSVLLLAGQVKGAEPLAKLMNTPIEALRAYLGGRAAYRRGVYGAAVAQLSQALDSDSTFAHSALALAAAANWDGDVRSRERGLRLAWKYQDKLSVKDRAYLHLFAGPTYPVPSNPLQFVDAGRRAVAIAADNPEVWYEYGDAVYHLGPTISMPATFRVAADAFRRAIALDPGFAAPREHLIDIYAREGDTTALRAVSREYLARTDTFGTATYTRWRIAQTLGHRAELQRLRASVSEFPVNALARMIGFGIVDGIATEDVGLAAAELRRRGPATEHANTAAWALFDYELNSGRPRAAAALIDLYQPFATNSLDLRTARNEIDKLTTAVWAAVLFDGDSAAGAHAARMLAGIDTRSLSESNRVKLKCSLGSWAFFTRDYARLRERTAALQRKLGMTSDPVEKARAGNCIILLLGSADFGENAARADGAIRALDSLLRVAPVLGHEGDVGQPHRGERARFQMA